jgi:ubiquinone/menaquinone biosynthesis C-methylase UbiE
MTTHEQWQLTMRAAELYERYPGRYFLAPWAPSLVDAARLAPGERVLDVACGTGIVARAAATRVGPDGHVVGIDINPGMIAVARSLPPAKNEAPIKWLERSALDLQLKNASFDAVLCQQGLQFFPDKAVALKEMRRVLDHGGRIALSVWDSTTHGPYVSAVNAALAPFVGNEVVARFTAVRMTPTADELKRLAMEADFSAVEVGASRINVHLPRVDKFVLDHLSATPIAADIDALGDEARRKIGASVMEQLQRYADDDGITFPEDTCVLTARAG